MGKLPAPPVEPAGSSTVKQPAPTPADAPTATGASPTKQPASSPAPAGATSSNNTPPSHIVEVLADGFRLSSQSIDITVRNGAVTRVVNLLTGEIHASGGTDSPFMPRGVLCATNGFAGVRLLHGQWTSHPLYGGQLGTSIASVDRAPNQASTMTTEVLPLGVRCTWRGLTCGGASYATDLLTVEATVDPQSGIIDITAEATSASHDVVGVIVPVVNLHTQHSMYVASFGGMVFTPTDLAQGKLRVLKDAPYIEAPILVAEGESGSLALWIEDQTFKPYSAIFGGDASNTAIGLEAINRMPFEGQRASRRATWRLGASAGTWPGAMEPYRAWYARTFANEITMRRANSWPEDIAVIVDRVHSPESTLQDLAQILNPSTVLLHEWNPRAASFDTELPDWTPRNQFGVIIKEGRRSGFRTMGYVNTYCVNHMSPVFQRDGIASFGLTRKIPALSAYGLHQETFAGAAPNQILYLDPLSPDWRRYHTDQMIEWQRQTGADANYEDTGGTAGDFGNGEIGGLFGAQGGCAQFRELLERNPVPMATEYAPDNIAFASSWSLRYSQAWGDANIRREWETKHRPITSLLFSGAGRAWVPTVAAESESLKWTVVACSDALGGVAQLEATEPMLKARAGIAGHMIERAKLFSSLDLKPDFSSWPMDPQMIAQYRAKDGSLYRYRVRGEIQELVDASGQPLYQRVTGLSQVDSPLRIANWPAWTGSRTIGLQTGGRYALGSSFGADTAVQIDKCPTGIAVTRYTESPGYALVTFGASGSSASSGETVLGLVARTDFLDVFVRSANGALVRRNAPLSVGQRMDIEMANPQHLLLIRQSPSETSLNQPLGMIAAGGRYLLDGSGIERGGQYMSPHQAGLRLAGTPGFTPFRFVAYGGDSEIAFERLVQVPTSPTSLRLTVRNAQQAHGNGAKLRVRVNGSLVFSRDLAPTQAAGGGSAWNTDAHTITVPLGIHRGMPVVVGVSIWGKGDDNADETWITEPILVSDPSQQLTVSSTSVLP
jgi:hypothetical protein